MPPLAGDFVLVDDVLEAQQASSDKPMCRLLQSAAGTSLVDSATTALAWDAEEYDTHGFHAAGSTLIVPTVPGYYLFRGTLFVPARADYITIGCVIQKNGGNVAPWNRTGPNTTSAQRTVSTECRIAMNGTTDNAAFCGYQDNTANAAASTPFGSSFAPVFECEFLRGL